MYSSIIDKLCEVCPVKSKTIAKSVLCVISIALFTKLLGFVKSVVIAGYLGANADTDVFYLALGLVTGVTYSIFTAITVSFIPLYLVAQKAGKDAADRFLGRSLFYFLLLSFALMVTVFVLAMPLARGLLLINDGLSEEELAFYIRILSPIFFIGCINTVFGAVLEANKSFALNKSLGLLISLAIIFFLVFFSKQLGARALAYGYIVGYLIQLVLLFRSLRQYNRITLLTEINSDVNKLFRLLLPLLIGNGIYEINKLIDKVLAAGVGTGGPTALAYAQTLFDSLCALSITSAVSVLFSYTSGLVVTNDYKEIKKNITDTTSVLLLITAPFAVMLLLDGTSIVRFIYERGAFKEQATFNTAYSLMGYAVGIPFLVFREVLAKAHYAFKNSKDPMKNSVLSAMINIMFSVFLSRYLGIAGITIATSISYFVCSMLLNRTIKKSLDYTIFNNKTFYCKLFVSMVVMSMIVIALKSSFTYSKVSMVINVFVSFTLYFTTLYVLKCKQVIFLIDVIKKKLAHGVCNG